MKPPQSLGNLENFPYKEELIAALQIDVPCKRLDAGDFLAGNLAGTYQIRLRIAKDPAIRGKLVPADDRAVRDLTNFVNGLLAVSPETILACYSIGPTKSGFKYALFEQEGNGQFVGCLCGPYEG